jgi:hypothetical protein
LTGSLELSYKGPGGVILRGLTLAQQILWIGSIAGRAILIVRLFSIGPTRYRWFITYLIISSAGTLYLWSVPVRSAQYTVAWIIIQFATLFLLYAAALEIYSNLAQLFGGVDRRGRIVSYFQRVLNLLMALSLVVCIAFTAFDARSMLDRQFFSLATALSGAVLLKRIATSTLAAFLAGSALYFSRFRTTDQPNLRVHGLLFAGWMVVSALALFWRNLDRWSVYGINVVFLSMSVLIFAGWAVALRKSGEKMRLRVPVSGERDQADREILISFLKRLTRQR